MKSTTVREKSKYILVAKRDNQLPSDKSTLSSTVGTEVLEESGTLQMIDGNVNYLVMILFVLFSITWQTQTKWAFTARYMYDLDGIWTVEDLLLPALLVS